MFGPCQYDPSQHQVIHPPLEAWVKRQASPEEQDKIFVYHHLKEKTFVIGWWVNKGRGLFVDLNNLGNSLANFDSSDARALVCTLRSNNTKEQITGLLRSDIDSQFSRTVDESEAASERIAQNPMVHI